MSGLKYTPERAQQAAAQLARRGNEIYNYGQKRRRKAACIKIFVSLIVICWLILGIAPYYYSAKYKEEREAILNSACEEVYKFSYDSLPSFTFKKYKTIEVNGKAYRFKPKVEVLPPSSSDKIKEGVEYKKINIKCDQDYSNWSYIGGTIKKEFVAVPNKDGTFTIESFDDFKERMHE